jgi:hypothetical protein
MYYLLEPNYLSLLCKIKPWFVREWGAHHHHHHHQQQQQQQNAGNLREEKNEGWFLFSIQTSACMNYATLKFEAKSHCVFARSKKHLSSLQMIHCEKRRPKTKQTTKMLAL